MTSCESQFEQLLESARCGDGQAFELLYARLNQRVHAFARIRGADDPEGLVNEVFLAVFTRLGAFTGVEAQFNAWVFTIARNKLIDESRRRDRRPHEIAHDRASLEDIASARPGSANVEHEALEHITTAGLARTLEFLTDDQQEAVVLRIVADLDIDAIAETMGKSPGAVRALLGRAFRTIARVSSSVAVHL